MSPPHPPASWLAWHEASLISAPPPPETWHPATGPGRCQEWALNGISHPRAGRALGKSSGFPQV